MTARRFHPWLWIALLWLGWVATTDAATPRERDKIQTWVAENGLQVILIENHVNPMAEVRILARGGSVHDPDGREGLASLTAWMFNEGGGELDSSAFQERLHYYGISMAADVGSDTIEVHLTSLSEHLDEAFARLGDAMLRPRFAQADFERALRERSAELIKSEEEPAFRASRVLTPRIYGPHPYARPTKGTQESVKRIELADIRRHHAATFRAPGMVMAVAGDITRARLEAQLHTHLEQLPHEPGPFLPPPKAKPVEKGAETHIEMDQPQTTVRMGVVAIDREDADFYPLTVMNQLLGGGGLTSRLNQVVREERGLAYGIFSGFSPLAGRGPFTISTETKTESAREAIDLIRAELKRMMDETITEEELRDVQRYLTGSFPLHLDGLDKLAETWCRIGFYQRGLDYLDTWPERIRAVTRADVQRVAQRILNPDRLQTVTVGRTVKAAPDGDTRPETAASPPSR
ncbi:MAG: insulinase family protein [Magnetococcales bacterium]|nr:insulinase family protein [Magnetococcales bacterium]